jgi:hypothetical protein
MAVDTNKLERSVNEGADTRIKLIKDGRSTYIPKFTSIEHIIEEVTYAIGSKLPLKQTRMFIWSI